LRLPCAPLGLLLGCAGASSSSTQPAIPPPANSAEAPLRCLEHPDPDAYITWVTGVMDRTTLRVCLAGRAGPHRLAAFRDTVEIYDLDRAKRVRSITIFLEGATRAQSGDDGEEHSDPVLELANGDLVAIAHGTTALEVVVANPVSGVVSRHVTVPKCAAPE